MSLREDVLQALPQDEANAVNTRMLFTQLKGVEELQDISGALGMLFRANEICRKKDPNSKTNGFLYWIGTNTEKEKLSNIQDVVSSFLTKKPDLICDDIYEENQSQAVTSENKSALDSQIGGDHYKKLGAYQPWEVLHKWLTPEELKGFAKGTVIAYLAREMQKGGRQDIEKAAHSLEIYLELTK